MEFAIRQFEWWYSGFIAPLLFLILLLTLPRSPFRKIKIYAEKNRYILSCFILGVYFPIIHVLFGLAARIFYELCTGGCIFYYPVLIEKILEPLEPRIEHAVFLFYTYSQCPIYPEAIFVFFFYAYLSGRIVAHISKEQSPRRQIKGMMVALFAFTLTAFLVLYPLTLSSFGRNF